MDITLVRHNLDAPAPLPIEHVRESYERIYRGGGLVGSPGLYRWIIRILNPAPGLRLLDVACGEGGLIREAVRRGVNGYGLDLACAAIEKAQQNAPGGRFVIGDAQALPFHSEQFDYVTCLGSLENMPDPWTGLSEIRRVTKRQGTIGVMVPNAFWLGDVLSALWRGMDDRPFQAVERRASRRAWRHFLLAGGLVVERELRYNRPAVLLRRGKVKSVRKFLKDGLRNLATPFNLSLEFVYLCRKAAPSDAREYWLWRAERAPSP